MSQGWLGWVSGWVRLGLVKLGVGQGQGEMGQGGVGQGGLVGMGGRMGWVKSGWGG